MHSRVKISDAFGDAGAGYDNSSSSSSGGSSPASPSNSSGHSDSDGGSSGSSADELRQDLREFRHRASDSSSSARGKFDPSTLRSVSESSARAITDIDRHQHRMLLLLPAFSSAASPDARADALSSWLSGFDVGWVLDMDALPSGKRSLIPRREIGRRVRVWAQALSTMERVFRLRHRQVTDAQVASLGNLAAASASAMLKLANTVAALSSSPSKLLAVLDVYVPVSDVFPVLARMFSWDASSSHPVPAAVEATLAELVDAARRCGRDLRESITRSPCCYPSWRMPQGGEVHPCVGFWMGYLRCMLRNRVTLYLVLGNEEGGGLGLSLVADLVSCLEAALEDKSAALAFPGLRHVFMLNNTFAIVRGAVRSDLKLFLPSGWVRIREQRMEGYIRGYLEASWAPVVSRLDNNGGGATTASVLRRYRSNRLSAFYTAMENACSAQREWKVPNPVLRGILRKTVSEKVVPVYRRYLEDHPEVQVTSERTSENLERQLSDLFEG